MSTIQADSQQRDWEDQRQVSEAKRPGDEVSFGLLRRIQLQYADRDHDLAIGFTSGGDREGCSTVALKFAIAAAHSSESPVVFVDAEPRKERRISQVLELEPFESGNGPLDCHSPCGATLSRSRLLPKRLRVFQWSTLKRLDLASYDRTLKWLRNEHSALIFDLPKANESTACSALARKLDGVVLVIEGDKTKREVAQRSVELLRRANAEIIGAVYNKRHEHVPAWLR